MEETIQRAVEQNVLELAQNIEDQVDERLKQLENLEENDLEMIKRKRLEEMKRFVFD
jgi:acetyl-CoA carboxylase alpha subunit